MANYRKNTFVSGKWATKSELYDRKVGRAKIVSETNPEPSAFKDDDGNVQEQDVCKVRFEGIGDEALKVSLNRATINALVDAFGEDSKNWQGHYLSVEIDKLPGKKFPLYLIPEEYVRVENANGYYEIVKKGTVPVPEIPIINDDGESKVNIEDVPF